MPNPAVGTWWSVPSKEGGYSVRELVHIENGRALLIRRFLEQSDTLNVSVEFMQQIIRNLRQMIRYTSYTSENAPNTAISQWVAAEDLESIAYYLGTSHSLRWVWPGKGIVHNDRHEASIIQTVGPTHVSIIPLSIGAPGYIETWWNLVSNYTALSDEGVTEALRSLEVDLYSPTGGVLTVDGLIDGLTVNDVRLDPILGFVPLSNEQEGPPEPEETTKPSWTEMLAD